MSKKHRIEARIASGFIEVKSKFDAEFRRFALRIKSKLQLPFEEFSDTIRRVHSLGNIVYTITYTDPEGDLLPINNDDNLAKALSTARPLLRLVILRKGESQFEINGYGTVQRKRNVISKLIPGDVRPRQHVPISLPEDFRQVSAIIDVDILPETQRRVKLMRNGSDKPLGFYIRDGFSVRVMPNGLDKVPAIYISRLIKGGLAASTGLLAVDDEVLEVNGIEVAGKTLDQVTDMMVANSANLIITIKPVNQNGNTIDRNSRETAASEVDLNSSGNNDPIETSSIAGPRDDDEDEIEEFVVADLDSVAQASEESKPEDFNSESPQIDGSLSSDSDVTATGDVAQC